MKKSKKIVISILVVGTLLVLPIYNNVAHKNVSKSSENIIISTLSLDRLYDYSDPKEIEKHIDNIALIKIDEIKGVSNINPTSKENTLPYTFGTATVLSVIKGEINSEHINFARLGGVMSFEEWIKGEDDAEKVISVMEQNNISSKDLKSYKVETKLENDIELSKDKYYLAYLSYTNNNFGDIDFSIVGEQYGLREIKLLNSLDELSISNLLVKNNDTQSWVKLSDVVTLK